MWCILHLVPEVHKPKRKLSQMLTDEELFVWNDMGVITWDLLGVLDGDGVVDGTSVLV